MTRDRPFRSIYSHGFVRVAVATPGVALAAPDRNVESVRRLVEQAVAEHALVVLFPELSLSAYSIDDLLQQDALLDAVEDAAGALIAASRDWPALVIAGAPVRSEGRLYNAALVIHAGRLLGVVPKTYLPNYREFYEKRHFTSGAVALADTIALAGQRSPFGRDLVFEATAVPDLALHVEICEDLWVPAPPSTYAALGGATILANLSASDVTIGKAEYRRLLCQAQSAKCLAAYLYAGAGYGESTTDLAWDGHALIYENGDLLAESARFGRGASLLVADLDLDHLRQERARMTSFADCAHLHRPATGGLRRIAVDLEPPTAEVPLARAVARYPYVPGDPRTLDERCREVYRIQVQGLSRRMEAAGARQLVVGVSGGLDSTHALLVAAETVRALGLPPDRVLAVTMPGYATSAETRQNAWQLMRALGTTAREIDIVPASAQMLADIGHPFAAGERRYDRTFENVQAGERASRLFRLANLHDGLVVGTSDLSELALGYTTYGIGDHMAHYSVNASVPKTLIRHLIRWVGASGQVDPAVAKILDAVLTTEISPELVPADAGEARQTAEATVGPYPLQDFNLYYLSRFGFRPSKVAFLAEHAWGCRSRGTWPASIPESERREYDLAAIRHWLEVFVRRFFETGQFKRSALPNGPKVGSGGSLSPRGDWRAPSDATAEVWLDEIRRRVPLGSDRD
jgi:NAD+ synthase (glutamine-hydrolysing)